MEGFSHQSQIADFGVCFGLASGIRGEINFARLIPRHSNSGFSRWTRQSRIALHLYCLCFANNVRLSRCNHF